MVVVLSSKVVVSSTVVVVMSSTGEVVISLIALVFSDVSAGFPVIFDDSLRIIAWSVVAISAVSVSSTAVLVVVSVELSLASLISYVSLVLFSDAKLMLASSLVVRIADVSEKSKTNIYRIVL